MSENTDFSECGNLTNWKFGSENIMQSKLNKGSLWINSQWSDLIKFLKNTQNAHISLYIFKTHKEKVLVAQNPLDSPGKNTGVGSHSLLQGIFLTQGSITGLWHCRQILHGLSHKGSPYNTKSHANSTRASALCPLLQCYLSSPLQLDWNYWLLLLLLSFFCESKLNQLTASLHPFPFLHYFFISYENSTRIVSSHKPGSSSPWDDFAWILMYYFYSLNLQFVLIFIFPIFKRSLSVILQVMTKGLKPRLYRGNLTFLCKCCVHRINVWDLRSI